VWDSWRSLVFGWEAFEQSCRCVASNNVLCEKMDHALFSRHMGDLPRSWDGIRIISALQGEKRRSERPEVINLEYLVICPPGISLVGSDRHEAANNMFPSTVSSR
jgi:hypothetical protein